MEQTIEFENRLTNGGAPPDVMDFGFYHPFEYVETVANILTLSGWQCWPNAGGWNDQDSYLIDDIMLYFKLKARVRYEMERENAIDGMFNKGKRVNLR